MNTTTTPSADTAPDSTTTNSTTARTQLASASGAGNTPGASGAAYAYQARALQQPTPQQIRAARLLMRQTQAAASALVYRHDSARWREWERELDHAGRVIDLAVWELYLIKSGLRVNT